ncbi:hypothetical protein LTR66_009356 [Elasticomyces elasticus]|nr:hypothetical protein LTR66_009356 [Elasticomyces elasticus]KAK4988115.1 hypothetical protein LTR50_004137 [Elasticomyces elasticus]
MCRAFADPALTAFYQSPTLLSPIELHQFLELLDGERYIDYKVRTQQLVLDVGDTLAYQAHNRGAFDLGALVAKLPQLSDLTLMHPFDKPPYRVLRTIYKWTYPDSLFDELCSTRQRLKKFKWNTIMIGKKHGDFLGWIKSIHQSTPFQTLEDLVLACFGGIGGADYDPESDEFKLGRALEALPNLKALTFESWPFFRGSLLEHIPKGLERFTVENCSSLDSDMLHGFLAAASPSRMKELILDHNASLDLAFLPNLKYTCPKLEVLKMDLQYFSIRHTSKDAEAKYEYLLGSDEVPTWPSTLRTLELVHLQKWSCGAARNLFCSLVDSANELPDLRMLVLHAHLNMSWRERAGFREQWIERLQRVFLRKPDDPNPHLASMKTFRLWRQAQKDVTNPSHGPERECVPKVIKDSGSHTASGSDSDNTRSSRRRLSHVRVTPLKAGLHANKDSSDSDAPLASRRRSERIQKQTDSRNSLSPPNGVATIAPGPCRKRGRSSADAISVASDDQDANSDWRSVPEKFIQGMCEVVDIRIDNQRPREEQFNENDFLDSEASGDEDWNGDDEDHGGGGYAW